MKDQDLLNCPLLQGLDPMRRTELIGLMGDSNVRERTEKCISKCVTADSSQHVAVAGNAGVVDFEKEVHTWKPQQPLLWRRSPKE